jgi:hypothetical protein
VALSYTIEGKGIIANADNYASDTAGGSWGVAGSGGASASLTTDTFYYGSGSISTAVSGSNKWAWVYHDIGAGNELDFGVAGAEENQFIYIWIHCPTIGLSATLANEGVSIRVGSGTGAYRTFVVAGSTGSNGWDGGWQCFVIDPTQTGSITDTGTPDLTSIRYIGAQLRTTSTAKGDNLFISQIAVGSGIRITGTSTTAWSDAVAYCTDLTNRAWGMLQEREGIYYAYGNIIVGDGTATTDFDDDGRIIQFGTSEYLSGTGTTFNSSLPTTAFGITLDDGTGTTTFTDGVIVGTDNGRSGSTILGNANENVFISFDGLTNAGSDVNLYGTTLKSLYGTITLEADTDHAYLGVNFIDCSQVDAGGGAVIRNCIFAETADADSALLWNESIDIQDSAFIANTTGAAIEHPSAAGTPYDYYDLTFSGNTFDGLNSSGTNITVNLNGTSDASTDEGANTITYASSATLTMIVKDQGGSVVSGAYAYIDDNNETPYIMNTTTNASGIATTGHTAGAVTGATWRVRKYGYKPFVVIADIPASGATTIPVTLITDPQQT